MEVCVQKAIYSMFTIHLALIFRVYEIHQSDFMINTGACILLRCCRNLMLLLSARWRNQRALSLLLSMQHGA